MPLPEETSSAKNEAREALYKAITEAVADLRKNGSVTAQSEGLKNLAEAYAWVTSAAQPH
jgi:hypothetical protein